MRELQLWGVEEGVDNSFADIRDLAARCRFSNCGHTNEPGCAVIAAIEQGTLDRSRYESYRKLKDEQARSKPAERKPSALAGKPGWRNKTEGSKPFRHREHRDD
jgi:ribosome biogenesis GTPase